MGLSEKFPRILMYSDVSIMGLGFLRPIIIINQLQVKMYVGHTRMQSDTYEMIETIHETIQFNSGLSQPIDSIPRTLKYWKSTWLDEAQSTLHNRNLELQYDRWNFNLISVNKTLMDYAMTYTTNKKQLQYINFCRRYKKIIYPIEIVGLNGRKQLSTYITRDINLSFLWGTFRDVTKPGNTAWMVWDRFKRWLTTQSISYVPDINMNKISEYFITDTEDIIAKKVDNGKFIVYEKLRIGIPTFTRTTTVVDDVVGYEPCLIRHTNAGKLIFVDRIPNEKDTRPLCAPVRDMDHTKIEKVIE